MDEETWMKEIYEAQQKQAADIQDLAKQMEEMNHRMSKIEENTSSLARIISDLAVKVNKLTHSNDHFAPLIAHMMKEKSALTLNEDDADVENPGANDEMVIVDSRGASSFENDLSMSNNTGNESPNNSSVASRFGGSIDAAAILDFVNYGHDLIIAADKSSSKLIREIVVECGVDFDEDLVALVIDHTSYAVSETEGDHTLIASDDIIQSEVMLGSKKIEAPVLYKGVGHFVNLANGVVLKVLSASPKSKLSNPPTLSGFSISLGSTVQARNNAYILISGSLSIFNNRFFQSGVQKSGSITKYEKYGNEQFLTELSKWVFHERGHLKAANVRHNKVGEVEEPSMYRIKDVLEYSLEAENMDPIEIVLIMNELDGIPLAIEVVETVRV